MYNTQWAKSKENTYVPHKELYRVIHGLGDPDLLLRRGYETPLPF